MAEDTLIRVVEEREALRAEVARLREELEACENAAAKLLVAERAAHEATKAELAARCQAAEQRVAALEAQSKLYDQECGMCGSTAEELVEYQQWLESGKPTDAVTPEERAVLEACATAEVAQLSNGWRMLDGDSNRAVAAAELARRAAKEAK